MILLFQRVDDYVISESWWLYDFRELMILIFQRVDDYVISEIRWFWYFRELMIMLFQIVDDYPYNPPTSKFRRAHKMVPRYVPGTVKILSLNQNNWYWSHDPLWTNRNRDLVWVTQLMVMYMMTSLRIFGYRKNYHFLPIYNSFYLSFLL